MSRFKNEEFKTYNYTGDACLDLSRKGILPEVGGGICIKTSLARYVLSATSTTEFNAFPIEDDTYNSSKNVTQRGTDPETEEFVEAVENLFSQDQPLFAACISRLILTCPDEKEETVPPVVDLWLPLYTGQKVSVTKKVDGLFVPSSYLGGKLEEAYLAVPRKNKLL